MDNTITINLQHLSDARICPSCGTENRPIDLPKRQYRCGECGLGQAHLDYAANGAVQSVYGWLLTPGDVVLGRYRVRALLGKGGFGAAYLADDMDLNGRRRALKQIPLALFDEHEAMLLTRLHHVAIPDIIEHRTVNDMVYLVMNFGGSRTLADERKRYPGQRVPLTVLLPWIQQLCEVLDYLHQQNPPVIHRDLKPDNILLNDDGRVMLIDFGIAKQAAPHTQTRTLGRAASHGFSPPEQVLGAGTDERADIYALGATFYALLTGQNPPAAHQRVAGMDLASPATLVADVPQAVTAAILSALRLDANERPESVMAFAQRLTDEMDAQAIPAKSPRHNKRVWSLAAGVATLAFAVYAYFVAPATMTAQTAMTAVVSSIAAEPFPVARSLYAIRSQRIANGSAVLPPRHAPTADAAERN